MGYWSCLHIVDVQIKPGLRANVAKAILKSQKADQNSILRFFLSNALLDAEGWLWFKAQEGETNEYAPGEDGEIPAINAKWYGAEKIAKWLRRYSEAGGKLILHSEEGDGEAWGWEFDGKGRMRPLQLKPTGKWI